MKSLTERIREKRPPRALLESQSNLRDRKGVLSGALTAPMGGWGCEHHFPAGLRTTSNHTR